ncbi:hypothetical protein CVT24_000502 [Panaeolus cyanescens]|uniref:Cdc23 domain-containing protein n=1 Tax=Panaeolus cyanescens TaxID=181874 RepID=A0A409V8F0_9AGAR|nr:hypothetical protein CVT24_000502 [Panaeolus cyanescens]
MASLSGVDSEMVSELRTAAKECLDRGLLVAAKWASQLLLSVSNEKRSIIAEASYLDAFSTSTPARLPATQLNESFVNQSLVETQPVLPEFSGQRTDLLDLYEQHQPSSPISKSLEKFDEDAIIAARACFEAQEFSKVAYWLRDCKSSKAKFLKLYSQFIASERAAQRNWHKLDNSRHQTPVPINTSLPELLELVSKEQDPWLLFLRQEAIESILRSIASFKWNWSAWTVLANCINDAEELTSILQLIPLHSEHPLVQFFQIKTLNELHNPSDNELMLCDRLLTQDFFPNSLWVMTLRACVLYHLHDYGDAAEQFEQILSIDPQHMDDIDVYSNILYVSDNKTKLSKLAHEFLALDKDRPEVCCLIGNHYSQRAEHEKAVKYFRRATQLDRTCLSAWTLMGHEYVEMKNSHAAIEAYRRAVDVSRKDYRAWFGLGQAYELLSMHHYALHYYQRATTLRPYDERLWRSQALCYEEIGRLREAVECYKRALISADPTDTSIYAKLAKLHRTLNEPAESVAYHRRVVEICQANAFQIQEYSKSCIEVAEYEVAINGDLRLAHRYLELVANSNSEDVTKASELLKNLKAKLQLRAVQGLDNHGALPS